ncbi:MAG: esterase [Lachnospiraceae bacterium]|nr:esterase [Lachnospiraceae bacterium]
MKIYEYGKPEAGTVLIQPVDDHDLQGIENEVRAIAESTRQDFRLLAVKVGDWNHDLSPWKAPAVFGNEDFGDGAADTLKELLSLCTDQSKRYLIGGYSLSGLFALWAAYQTDVFQGVAAASPSIWFPNFTEYMKEHTIRAGSVYLSLGDRESRTRHPVMSLVGERIEEAYAWLRNRGKDCILEWNRGNHFADPDLRTAKAFAWAIDRKQP